MPPEEDPLARSKLVVVAFYYTHTLIWIVVAFYYTHPLVICLTLPTSVFIPFWNEF